MTHSFEPPGYVDPSALQPNPTFKRRFHALLQSPRRAAIVRLLHGRPKEIFGLDALVDMLGASPAEIAKDLGELGDFSLVRPAPDDPTRFTAAPPWAPALRGLLDEFLKNRARRTTEELSAAVLFFRELIGQDPKMHHVFDQVRMAAASNVSVLLLGATGTGKEVLARILHELSRRGTKPLQTLNCAALPDTLFESEIFGYEKGAFTGAHGRKPGRLELADHGTLFLDEIGDLSLNAQAKLLRVLEERRFERLGSTQAIDVDFRLISATNRPLETLVAEGRFRQDLFFRINGFSIRLPSLKERPSDIATLAHRFLARHCSSHGWAKDAKTLAPDAIQALIGHDWPGNIRELESSVIRAAIATSGDEIHAGDLTLDRAVATTNSENGAVPLEIKSLRDAERDHINSVLGALKWNKQAAARALKISRATLYRKIVEHDLDRRRPILRRANGRT